MYDATLIYDAINGSTIQEMLVDVYVELADIYGKEFYMSYQAGINIQIAFKINKYDFYETEHIEKDTLKLKYASQLLYDGARYDIVRYQNLKDTDMILLLCN
jgi:hypothetical protein